MILGDNPTGHAFLVKDLVLIELSAHAPPPLLQLGGEGKGGLKVSENILLAAGSEILILVVVLVGGGGCHIILK